MDIQKTFRLCAGNKLSIGFLILQGDTMIGDIGGEIGARIAENCFSILDAPVMRCASLDTPVPFSIELENNFLERARSEELIQKLINY